MKQISMRKAMAGPQGVRTIGRVYVVSDDEAQQLVEAEAAVILGTVHDADVLTPDKETTAVTGAPERAVATQSAPKKRTKKAE
ncbi:MAG: hypothetical protein R2932_59275 [Caldilineaceae bacterium]